MRRSAHDPSARRLRRASRVLTALMVSVSAVVACSDSDDAAGDPRETPDTTVEQSTTSAGTSSTLGPEAASTPSTDVVATAEALLEVDRETLSTAAASGDFCTAYGAYDLLASRTDDPTSAEAVSIFRLGFEATTGIGPLVPEEIEDSWSTFVFGAGLIDRAVAETGRLPDDPELESALDRLGYYEAGDDVTRWYLGHCG